MEKNNYSYIIQLTKSRNSGKLVFEKKITNKYQNLYHIYKFGRIMLANILKKKRSIVDY